MNEIDANLPRFTSPGGDGEKPRVRGNSAQFGYMVDSFRNMGLDSGGLAGDVSFTPPIQSANQETTRYRDRGLKNSRDAERNTELVRGGLDRKANSAVGASLRANPQPDITWLGQDIDWMLEYQQAAGSVFQEWATDIHCRCDAEGHYQFSGLMWQGFRTLTGPDAEMAGFIGYDRERADRLGHKWATFVSLIDPDRISNPNGTQSGPNQLVQGRGRVNLESGREVDEYGAMTGLHIGIRHPSEPGADMFRHEYVPRILPSGRAMGFHWFFKRRAGLQRALTSLAAVLSTIAMLNQFSKATLQSAVSHAYMAAYLKTTMTPEVAKEHLSPVEDDGRSEWDIKANAYEKMNLRFGGKRIPILGPNDEIKFESMAGTAMDFDPFRNSFLRELASSLGVSFEQLSLDFSRVSYSSARQSMIQSWANLTFEFVMFCNALPSLIYDAVIEEAFALGILKEPRGAPAFYEARQAYTKVQWIGPGMGWVDPLKEIDASKGRMGSGVSTLSREASSQGGVWHENILQRAMEQKFAEKNGIVLDVGAAVGASGAADAKAASDAAGGSSSSGDD